MERGPTVRKIDANLGCPKIQDRMIYGLEYAPNSQLRYTSIYICLESEITLFCAIYMETKINVYRF